MMSEYNTLSVVDPETMAVDGGILELEDGSMNNSNQSQQLSSPLLQSQPQTVVEPETTIEQTSQPDGSIIIKASTSTPHPNGFRDVKIEYYTIPSSAVGASFDSTAISEEGSPPLKLPSEYLTRVEYKTVTSDNDDDASTIYTALPRRRGDHHDNASISSSHCYTAGGTRRRLHRRSNKRKRRSYGTPLLITFVILFLIGIIGVSITRDRDGSTYENSTRDNDSSTDGKLKNDTLVNPTNGTNSVVVDNKNDTLLYVHGESEVFVSLS